MASLSDSEILEGLENGTIKQHSLEDICGDKLRAVKLRRQALGMDIDTLAKLGDPQSARCLME